MTLRFGLLHPWNEQPRLCGILSDSDSIESSLTYNHQGTVTFTLEELKGVPEDVISGYTKRTDGGKDVYDVTFKTPDIFPLVRPPSLRDLLHNVINGAIV